VIRYTKLQAQSEEMLHLDLTRLIASVGIVAHHSIEFFVPLSDRDWLSGKTMGLALFVDLFFVISGFVIANVYHDRAFSLKGYGESSCNVALAGWSRCIGLRWLGH
jgi:peptidoglycan/LPS O-acetylase OafA/YrhL